MENLIDDVIVFTDVSGYAMRECPAGVYCPALAKIAEKEMSALVLTNRFGIACKKLTEAAESVEPWGPEENPQHFPENLPYRAMGNLRGKELLLREVEADFGGVLGMTSTLEDLVCNAAIKLSEVSAAWQGCDSTSNSKRPKSLQARRKETRGFLRECFVRAGNDLLALEWLSELRNQVTHENYFFAAVVVDAAEVVFTTSPTDYSGMDYRNPNTATAKRLIQCVQKMREYLDWFYQESTVQGSPTLSEWRLGEDAH